MSTIPNKNEIKEKAQSTFSFLKDVAKVIIYDSREKTAAGLEILADKIDTTAEQKDWKTITKKKFEQKRAEKEAKHAQIAGIKC